MYKMNIDAFYKLYGTDTTTNFQLVKYARELKIPNFHVCMRDELRSLSTNKLPLNVITNIHTSAERGVHWSALHVNKAGVYFFDSYAIPPTQEIIDCLPANLERTRNTLQVQDFNTSNCGQLSLYVLYNLNKGFPFQDIIIPLYKTWFLQIFLGVVYFRVVLKGYLCSMLMKDFSM